MKILTNKVTGEELYLLCDFGYTKDGRPYRISTGEILNLEDWYTDLEK